MANAAPLALPRSPPLRLSLPLLFALFSPTQGLGLRAGRAIRVAIVDRAARPGSDATTVPVRAILSALDPEGRAPAAAAAGDGGGGDPPPAATVSYAADLVPRRNVPAPAFASWARARYGDCRALFDGYDTRLLRCEILPPAGAPSPSPPAVSLRWRAEWTPPGSAWLYALARAAGWAVDRRSPDPARVATFNWAAVLKLFRSAFASGEITLPVSVVEGTTVVAVRWDPRGDARGTLVSVRESIDLVEEADGRRLRNRRAAQELAAWLDVARRPPDSGVAADEDADGWAGAVRARVLAGVPGAGALDVDPNEDDAAAGIAAALFGAVCLASLALSFEYFLGGGPGAVG